ncbi:MAG: hypothetical protein IH624_11460 [Phycisphaerae bacterium]|nr:hypothetical protein [Phycisphaerae bacterium]
MHVRSGHKMLAVCGAIGAVLLLCAGCDRQEGAKEPAPDWAIEKHYTEEPLSVTVRLSGTRVAIADLVRMEVEAVAEPGYMVTFPNVAEALTGLQVRDERSINERLDEANRIVRTRRYRLEPVAPGNAAIGKLKFQFGRQSGGSEMEALESEPIEIKVTSLLEELGTQLVIEDIEGVVELPAARWPWWASGGAVIAAAGAIVMWRRRRGEESRQITRIFRAAHEIAYEILRKLAEDKLVESGRIKEFHERLSNCLRHYIEYRFALKAPERTTEEFLAELGRAETLAAEHREDLRQFLEHCDLVKFAKYEPSVEQIEEALRMVERFVDKTRSDECRVEVTEGIALEGGK